MKLIKTVKIENSINVIIKIYPIVLKYQLTFQLNVMAKNPQMQQN